MQRALKVLHIGLIFLIPVIFGFLKLSANDYDAIILKINRILYLVGAIWASYLTVELIRKGSSDGLKSSLLKKYQELLAKNLRFLLVSNLLLLIVFCFLMYQLLAFRKVEFIATDQVELFESKPDGKMDKIGDIPPNKIISYRVKSGIKNFLFRNPLQEEFTSLEPIEIFPVWKQQQYIRIKLIPDEHFKMLK